jgi:tight adherence protein B
MTPTLIALFVFLAIVSAWGALLLARRDGQLASTGSGADGKKAGGAAVRLRRLPQLPEGKGAIRSFDRWFVRLLRDSGLGWQPTSAALLIVFCGMAAGSVLFLWQEHPLVAMGGILAGVLVPLTVMLYKCRKRTKQLHDQLPAALDMLARCVRAGQSLDQAIEVVGTHSPEPLAAEFRMCGKQLEMGLSIPAVMRSLVERVRLYDVRIFTTTLIVHRQTGGNLARMLQRLAKVIRDRLSYRRQLRVSTGAGRASAMLVGLMGPVVFLFFFFCRPEYFNAMLESTLGQSLLIIAAALEIIGLIWTARLMKPAY